MDEYRDMALGVEAAWPVSAARGKKAVLRTMPWVPSFLAGLIAATVLALL